MKNHRLSGKIRALLAGGILGLLSLSACATFDNPSDERMSLVHRSRILLETGKLVAAESLTEGIIARFGPSPFLLNQMAVIREREGKADMAQRVLAHAHHLYPGSSVLTVNLAAMELAHRNPVKARETLKPLLDQKSWPEGFRTLMGRIDLETGNLPEAHLFLHEALSRHPDNPLILATMGLLHSRLGLRKKAREDFRRAMKRSGNSRLRSRIMGLLAANK